MGGVCYLLDRKAAEKAVYETFKLTTVTNCDSACIKQFEQNKHVTTQGELILVCITKMILHFRRFCSGLTGFYYIADRVYEVGIVYLKQLTFITLQLFLPYEFSMT